MSTIPCAAYTQDGNIQRSLSQQPEDVPCTRRSG
jgi:hypothetical protein